MLYYGFFLYTSPLLLEPEGLSLLGLISGMSSDADSGDSEEDEVKREEREQLEAGETFCELMVQHYLDHVPMRAMTLCVLMHYATWWGG